jgi:primary-amine oxidase
MEPRPDNLHDNAFFGEETLLATEKAARRPADPARARYWKIVNPHARNALGQNTSFRLLPQASPLGPKINPAIA